MGVHTIRIYNPVKQSMEQDADGLFIKKWLPVLDTVPIEYLHQPWLMPLVIQNELNIIIGVDYPNPIVDIKETAKYARENLWQIKKSPKAKLESQHILQVHVNTNQKTKRTSTKKINKATSLKFNFSED
jgi:deoxyribodipyrimidine photo-lyase